MLQSNMPTFTYVKWSGLVIRYNNDLYNISDYYTNKKYIYFDTTNPYELVDVNVRFKDDVTKYLIFLNDKGIGTVVPQDDLALSWNGNNDKLIKDRIFGLYDSVDEHKKKFVSIETDIDGIVQTVGSVEQEQNKVKENVSKIEQRVDNIDLSVRDTVKEFSENKELNLLRENLNKSIIELNSALGIFKSEIYTFYKDNKITSEEKLTINTHLGLLEGKTSEVENNTDVVISLCNKNLDTNNANFITSSKNKVITAIGNLKTYITTAISDNTVVPSEITAIIDLFGKCNVAINNLKNTCDNAILLGAGGSIIEELARIGIKSDEIVLSVSKVEEDTRDGFNNVKEELKSEIKVLSDSIDLKVESALGNSVNEEFIKQEIEKERLDINEFIENETSDLNSSIKNMLNYVDTSFKDGVLDESEKAILEETLLQLLKEKADIDSQLSTLLSSDELVGTEELSALQSAKSEFEKAHNNYTSEITRITNLPIPPYVPPVINKSSKIHFIATDHDGDCILIQTSNGKNILVDANERVTSTQIINYLKSINVDKIDTIIITHYHSDHVGAMPLIMDYVSCEGITAYHRTPDWSKMGDIEINEWLTKWYYDEFISKCNSKGVNLITPTERQRLNLGEGEYIEFYNTNNQDYSNYNSLSFGLLYVLGDSKCFLAGDMTYNSENLVGKGTIGKVDLHKTGHHAWNYSTQEWFAKELGAKYNIITTLYINDETRKNARAVLQKNGLNVYSQATNGTIVATVKPSGVTIDKTNTDVLRNMWWQHQETNDWYWWKNNGQLAKSETLRLDDKDYDFDSNGICLNKH